VRRDACGDTNATDPDARLLTVPHQHDAGVLGKVARHAHRQSGAVDGKAAAAVGEDLHEHAKGLAIPHAPRKRVRALAVAGFQM
jgi:hypothetical protein